MKLKIWDKFFEKRYDEQEQSRWVLKDVRVLFVSIVVILVVTLVELYRLLT